MLKRRNRVYRRIAVALTVALLAGQSHAFVLAEEGDAPQTEITEAVDTISPDNGDETGGGSTENGENGFVQGGAANGNTENNRNGNAQGGNAENNNGGADNLNPEENENTGDQQGDRDEQDKCICDTKCVEDAVNTECPVCAADYTKCVQNAGEGVKPAGEEGLEEDERIETLADEGVEARAVGDTFTYTYEGQTLKYKITKEDGDTREVEVCQQFNNPLGREINIPSKIKDLDGNEYSVTSIGTSAFEQHTILTSIEIPDSVTSIGESAFFGCRSLSSVESTGNLTSIGEGHFTAEKITAA